MTLSLYEGNRYHDGRVVMTLIVVNATFAAASLFWWTMLSLFVAEPIRWATWHGVSPNPDLFEYPFTLLWLMPLACAVAAWVARSVHQQKAAFYLAAFPPVLLGFMAVSYTHLTLPTIYSV